MTIYLIRHGATAANEAHLYCGATDLPLSPRGTEALSSRSYPPLPEAVYYTSGLLRCRQTLALLFGPVAAQTVPELAEMDFGAFEMKSYEELKGDPAYQAWLTGDNEKNPAPGGESGEEMTRRALAAFRTIAEKGENAVIVTHGGVMTAVMADLFPGEGKNRYQWQRLPGRGYRLEWNGAWRYWYLPEGREGEK